MRRSLQQRTMWVALMAFTVFCLAFQYAEVLIDVMETRYIHIRIIDENSDDKCDQVRVPSHPGQ